MVNGTVAGQALLDSIEAGDRGGQQRARTELPVQQHDGGGSTILEVAEHSAGVTDGQIDRPCLGGLDRFARARIAQHRDGEVSVVGGPPGELTREDMTGPPVLLGLEAGIGRFSLLEEGVVGGIEPQLVPTNRSAYGKSHVELGEMLNRALGRSPAGRCTEPIASIEAEDLSVEVVATGI